MRFYVGAGLATLTLMLAGCGGSGGVEFVGGRPFITGGSSCATYTSYPSEGTIQCFTSNREYGEVRRSLNQQEMNYISAQQQADSQQMQAWSQSMQQANQSYQAPTYTPMTVPAVQPLTTPGSNQIRCIQTGISTVCNRY